MHIGKHEFDSSGLKKGLKVGRRMWWGSLGGAEVASGCDKNILCSFMKFPNNKNVQNHMHGCLFNTPPPFLLFLNIKVLPSSSVHVCVGVH